MAVSARDLMGNGVPTPPRPAPITGFAATIDAVAEAVRRETMRAATADLHRQLAELTSPEALMRAMTPTTDDLLRLMRRGAT